MGFWSILISPGLVAADNNRDPHECPLARPLMPAAGPVQAVLLVKASVETGYSMGQGLAQALGLTALLALSYLYVLRCASPTPDPACGH